MLGVALFVEHAVLLLSVAGAGCGVEVEDDFHAVPVRHGVVMRGSTGYDAMSDTTVARALTYVRTHAATGPVAVDEVAAASKCSRRYFERTFRAKLGRSVHEEIALARIERVKRLLETDSASIGEIIGITGFSGEKHLSILFRRITGTTMTDWRRAHRDQAK